MVLLWSANVPGAHIFTGAMVLLKRGDVQALRLWDPAHRRPGRVGCAGCVGASSASQTYTAVSLSGTGCADRMLT